jgi:hypothetical protein
LLFEQPGVSHNSPAIARGERVLYYLHVEGTVASIRRTERSSPSEPFDAGETDEDLSSACEPGYEPTSIDVSWDEQRAYVGCTGVSGSPTFVVELVAGASSGGWDSLGPIATLGGSAAIARDGLTLYSTGIPESGGPLWAHRDELDAGFGAAELVPGIAGVLFRTPCPGPDDKSLFGYIMEGSPYAVGYYLRPDEASPYDEFIQIPTGFTVSGAPDVTADCRTLYLAAVPEDGGTDAQLYVMRR